MGRVLLVALTVLAGLAMIVLAAGWLVRSLQPPLAGWMDVVSDGEPGRAVLVLLASEATAFLLLWPGVRLRRAIPGIGPVRRAARALVLVPGALGLVLIFCFMPPRGRSSEVAARVGGYVDNPEMGDALVATAVAGLLLLLATLILAPVALRRRRVLRLALGLLVALPWVLTAGLLHHAYASPGRGALLHGAVVDLRAGDDGLLGRFQPGLAVRVEETARSTALSTLGRPGHATEVPGCRTAFVVQGAGTTGPRHHRQRVGRIRAVVVQTWTDEDASEAERILGDAGPTLLAGRSTSGVVPVEKLRVVVCASEDRRGVPRRRGGATPAPLTRALVYVLLDHAEGVPMVPG